MTEKYFIFDTETTGLPSRKGGKYPSYKNLKGYDNSRIIEIAWMVYKNDNKITEKSYLIKPIGEYKIGYGALKCHGISKEVIDEKGVHFHKIIDEMMKDMQSCDKIVGYNVSFDLALLRSELYRINRQDLINTTYIIDNLCLMWESRKKLGYNKLVSCTKVYEDLYNKKVTNAHRALKDVEITAQILMKVSKIETPPKKTKESKTKSIKECLKIKPSENEMSIEKSNKIEPIYKEKITLHLTLKN